MPNSTNWTAQAINSTNYSVAPLTLHGIIMDDTVCKMDDSTFTMDDAAYNSFTPNSTTWTNT